MEPETGPLASKGEWGAGRLADPATILARVETVLAGGSGALAGLRVLVTAGGTREPIDSVRYVGNRSSGRMGVALAAEAAARGAEVTLVGANLAVARARGRPRRCRWRPPRSCGTPSRPSSTPPTCC